ncbi:hypothetical protein OGAPHI_000089 [Ogataea philodendri]|uniref:ditrans,polycis-polyprenyl diphosphate synthase [(2E,6E)-farnesyldiphosphate specific] n=1 Tax=Ogataea philodendri TaxID=1378263 RepID=A0A9P8PGN5_9ASCO|nr:uncharacterized protein OGAPHI_000089 [Ogataea philodendri]KAH3671903.1 hypothetical protein OGAPHI_000089 [Ogataea philodendri]
MSSEMKTTELEDSHSLENGFSSGASQDLVYNLVQQQQQELKEIPPTDSSNRDPVPDYSNDTVYTTIYNLFRNLIWPQAALKSEEESSPSSESSVSYYIYHSILVFFYLLMSIYRFYEYTYNRTKLRFLNLAYNPSRAPSLINSDVNKLPKIPYRISAILNYKSEQEENGGVEGLCNDASEIAAWCLSSGIPNLTIYEYHGVLKKHVPELRRSVYRKLVAYFGTSNVPTYRINIPHLNVSYAGSFDDEYPSDQDKFDIEISLISVLDGRSTIVELTKVMSHLSKTHELSEKDINLKFIDQELQQLVGHEPDLIVMFQPYLNLQGYPPWHTRLSEMYWEPDNEEVTYAVFLRALQKYSTCKVNVGR